MSFVLTPEQIARVCYEADRAYCMATGDHSLVPWDGAPAWQREGALAGVLKILEDPELTPEQTHEAWLAHKKEKGWRHGKAKVPEQLEHPRMVPYVELSLEQQAKVYLMLSIVRGLQGYTGPALAEAAQPPPPAKKKRKKKKPAEEDAS